MENGDDSEFEGEELLKLSHEAKLKELLRNLNSAEIKLCSNASKEFIKLLRGHAGGELLRIYVQTSSKLSELLQAWNFQLGKPGLSYVLKLVSTILSHPEGLHNSNNAEGVANSRALDKFARSIFEEKLGDLYKELNSKEAKHQNAALLLLASIVRRGSGLASDVAKSFDFKLPIFPKLAEYKQKKISTKRKHSTRRAFVGFAMSFLEVGKPGLLRWVLQQKEMYSGVLRGIGSDDEEIVVFVLSTLRDRILVPESLVPPSLRSVLFGSVTLEQLVNISGREDGRVAAELAHRVLVTACTDPSNGLMPDLNRHPSPLKGNLKRLLDLMKKLKATEFDYHRDLLFAIVKGRPLFGSAYMDEFPYNVEDNASPNWFAAVSLAANLVSSVGSGLTFDFKPEDPPSFTNPDVQSLIKCICPRPFTRVVVNKGLLHTNSFAKHGTLRLVLEELKLLDSFITAVESNFCSSDQMRHKWASLKQDIQNEVRILLPDTQVLLSLLSSLGAHSKSLESSLKRVADTKISLEQGVHDVKRLKTDAHKDDLDILVSGVSYLPEITLPKNTGVAQGIHDVDDLKDGDDNAVIADIWGLRQCSESCMTVKDEEIHFYSRLLDALKIYHRTMPGVLVGSFEFFKFLPSNPLALPTILQQSLLSLLLELIGWSPKCKIAVRIPPMMYKHLQPFINLLLYSPIRDIKDLAHILAQTAMSSTGAFDKNLREIGVWFSFLPGCKIEGNFVGDQGIEGFQNLFSVIVSFLCDAVSTVGNNLLKYWDALRGHICHLKGVEDVSPEFGPLFICVLEKCLRVLSSESGTFSIPEKSMIALYVCNTIKYLLQTQVETRLLYSLVDLLLSERVEVGNCCSLDDGNAQDLCEWRPLKNLFLFSRHIQNLEKKPSPIEREVLHADSSFANILGEVKRIVRSGSDSELVCIGKAFVLSLLSTPPTVILRHFPSVISALKNLSGFPFSVLLSIFFLEPDMLYEVSKLWPEMFRNGLERFMGMDRMVHGKEPINGDMNIDAIESSSAAFCFFLKQAPFYVLFPATVRVDGLHILEGLNLQYLLQAKFSEVANGDFVSAVLLVLFWLHQIRLSHRIKPSAEFEQLSGTCSILIEKMLAHLQDSPIQSIFEVTEVILCHPVVMMSLQYPLGHREFTEAIFGESSENFLILAGQGIHEMDHHVLNLLTSVCKHLVTCCNGQNSFTGVDYLNQRFLSSFKALVKRLNRIFRDRFDKCIKTGDLRPLTPTLYALHSLIHFISPLELLELVLWIFSRIDLSDFTLRASSDFSLLVGLSIAGCAFDMLATYLQQPYTRGTSSNIFWEMEDKPFDVLLFERVYFQVIELAMRFELDAADRCLLKAVNVANNRKVTQTQWLPLTMDLSRVVHNTPIEVLSHFIHKTSMTRANMLFRLTELSPIHLVVFGHFFSDVMNECLLPKDDVTNETCCNMLLDDNFVMLLPTAFSYLISASMKYGEQFHKYGRSISSFYYGILFRRFSGWKSYATMDIFNIECIEFLLPSVEELLDLLSHSLLGKSVFMFRYYLTLNGDAVKLKKRLKLFNSVCPRSGVASEDLLDCDVSEIDAYSPNQSLNLVNRVVAKIYLCRMLLFLEGNQIRSTPKEGGNTKEIHSEVGSNKEDSARVRFMNLLLKTWHIIVRKFPSNSDDTQKSSGNSYFLFRFLEVFISRNILELTRAMRDCSFIEQLARLSFLHRFGDLSTMKMLRGVLSSLSNGNSHILLLQLLLAHSQFAPSILSSSQSSGGSQFGMMFRPMASILRLLVIPSTDQNALYGENRQQKTSEIYMKQLEVLRLLRALFFIIAQQSSFDFEKDISANPRELLFLLLSSYGATLSEVDLEIYNLMLEIESANVSNSGRIAQMDYLWGSAAIRIRKEREQEQDLSSDMIQDVEAVERRRTQFRENLHIDPKMCAYTVLHFPYGRTIVEDQPGNSDDMNETNCPGVEKIRTYDPVFILRFSIHSLSMGFIEPVEFASLGLLAIAFVSISSPHDEMRKLGYEALGGFKTALEKCQKRKDLMRLRLLLTYLQNGIEEPWQRIPSITAKFVAEASVILLDPLHDHYSTISKFLMSSARVNMKSVPLFANFLWSSSVNFRTDRLWMLRLLYAGLDSDDDARIYIRNNILEILLVFYASPLSDVESKELTLQVVKKSVKVRKMARHLVERCSIIPWLSSIVSVFYGKQYQALTNLSRGPLNTALEVVNDVISNRNIIEWLQQFALEQLSELSTHLYKLLVGGNLIDENDHLVTSVLEILTSTLKISQERKVYQPHFTLSVEGLFKIYKVVNVCRDGIFSPCAELGLKAVLMSTPPGAILCMEQDKLLMFVRWATSTALQSSSVKELQPTEAYCHSAILLEREQSEDSLLSKLLRWLTASVILGRLSLRFEKSNLETLHSLLELDKKGCGESQFGFGCEEILASCIFGLQQLIGMGCRLLPSVVAALSLLLFSDLLNLAGSEMNCLLGNENTLASLWSRVRCPVEANPSWRWSFYKPWKDLSSKSTDSATMDELHACESLLVIISNVIGKKSLHSQFLSHQDLENSGVFNWERRILESE